MYKINRLTRKASNMKEEKKTGKKSNFEKTDSTTENLTIIDILKR